MSSKLDRGGYPSTDDAFGRGGRQDAKKGVRCAAECRAAEQKVIQGPGLRVGL